MFSFFKKKNIISVIILVVGISFIIYAIPTGIVGVTKKNGDGCTCHTPEPSTNVTVTINGPDQLTIGETAEYSVTISGGPLAAAGTNIAASSGNLVNIGSDLQVLNGELTHTAPKTPSNNMVTFNFDYTAPNQPGEIILYANGNSVNLNGTNIGDQWNFAPNKTVLVTSATNVNEDETVLNNYKLYQNYPNPFNPSTTIEWNMKQGGNVQVKILDINGNELSVLIDEYRAAGKNSVNFNASNLSSGVYFYKIITPGFSGTKKMLLLK